TAYPFASVADRLRLLVALLAVGDGRVLLAAHSLPVRRRRHGPRRRFVDGRPDRPQRLLETDLLFHAEDSVGDLALNALPHRLDLFTPLPLVFGLGIDLGVTDQPDARAEVVHRVQVVLPRRVEPIQYQATLHAPHLRPVALIEGVP